MDNVIEINISSSKGYKKVKGRPKYCEEIVETEWSLFCHQLALLCCLTLSCDFRGAFEVFSLTQKRGENSRS